LTSYQNQNRTLEYYSIMKKRIIKPLLLVSFTALLIASTLFLSENSTDPRKDYEEYLLTESKKISQELDEFNQLPKPGQPQMAAVQDFFMTLDPVEKRVPIERLKKAWKEMRQQTGSRLLKSGSANLEWDIITSNMGGRTRVIEFDPNYSGDYRVWAGSVTGGLWLNEDITNGFESWIPVDDFWPGLSISCIAFDPQDPNIMYVGTGEAFTASEKYRESSGLGVGIFKSDDNGDTWELLPSTQEFKYITDIEIREENGISMVYAGVVSGLYKGQTHQSLPKDGLYKSFNGGNSWTQVAPSIPGTNDPYAVADIEITENGRIFIGTKRNLNEEGGATILFSDSGALGSWTIFDDYVSIIENHPDYYIPGRVMLASSPSDPDVVYAVIGAGWVQDGTGFILSRGRHIARTDNGGDIWNYRPIPQPGDRNWASLAWHALTVAVDPNDPEHVWIGGLDVYKSEDGGFDWDRISDWGAMYNGGGSDYVHADIHDIDFYPGSSDELVITTDGGVFYTDDATNTYPDFQQKNLDFSSLQFYTCAIYPDESEEKGVGGLQDNGTLYYSGTPLNVNDMIDGGDGAYCFIDKNDPSIMITSVYYNRYTIFIDEEPHQGLYDWYSGIFINPSDYDYKKKIIYANAGMFTGYYNDFLLRLHGIPNNSNGDFVYLGTGSSVWFSHVSYSPFSEGSTSTLFVGSLSGRLFRVVADEFNSPLVTELTGNSFPEANISSVAIGGSEDTLLVTFSNYGVSSVWQTYDGGNSWQEKEGNLPDIPIRWALYHPNGSKNAMLATETGIWTTNTLDQATTTWTPDNEGLANVRVDMLRLREVDNTVMAATHGRGLATTTWDITTGINDDPLAEQINVYPNPSHGSVRISVPGNLQTSKIEVLNTSGRLLMEQDGDANGSIITLDLSGFSNGNYFIRIHCGDKSFTRKVVLVK